MNFNKLSGSDEATDQPSLGTDAATADALPSARHLSSFPRIAILAKQGRYKDTNIVQFNALSC